MPRLAALIGGIVMALKKRIIVTCVDDKLPDEW